MRDLNISFPIDRLRELVARGELGGLGAAPLLVHGRAARSPAHRGGDRARGGPAAARRGRRRRPHHAHLTASARTPGVCWPARSRAQGIATTSISMVREHTEKVKPPRALFVPFPFGHALGRPNDPALQHRVLRAALDLLAEPAGPVLARFPRRRGAGRSAGRARARPRRSRPPPSVPDDPALETAQMRQYHEQWLARSGGPHRLRAQRRARHALPRRRALPPGLRRRRGRRHGRAPARTSRWPNFIRYCADDSKALYFEGRMAMKPGGGRRRDRALVLGGDGRGPAPPPRPRAAGRLRGPALEGRRLRRGAVAGPSPCPLPRGERESLGRPRYSLSQTVSSCSSGSGSA